MPEFYLRGYAVAPVLEQLRAIEARVEPLPVRREVAHFHCIGNWLFERAYLRGLVSAILRGKASLPPRAPRSMPVLLRALVTRAALRARTSADALQFKHAIRAYYAAPGLTVKLATSDATGLAREVEMRPVASETLRCPQLVAAEPAASPAFLCEELLHGHVPRRDRDGAAVISFVLGPLWRHYERQGIEHRPCSTFDSLDALPEQVARTIDAVAWQPEWVDRQRLLDAAAEFTDLAGATVPHCLGHGDLTTGNMLLEEDGTVILLDWELSRQLPLFNELWKIPLQYPESWEPLVARVRDRMSRPDSLPPERQALLAAFRQLLALETPLRGSDNANSVRRRLLEGKRLRLLERELSAASRLLDVGRP